LLLLSLWVSTTVNATEAVALPDQSNHSGPVVLLQGWHLRSPRHAAHLELRPGKIAPISTLYHACFGLADRNTRLLLFFPDQAHCEQVTARQESQLIRRLAEITGQPQPGDLLDRLSQGGPIVLARRPATTLQRGVVCTCPDNNAPEGSVDCPAQSRPAGSRIATIGIQATDADGDPLFTQFSHQRDGGPLEAGLPAPLSSECSGSPGSLACAIDGVVAGESGNLQLWVAITDGGSTLDLGALINLTSGFGEPIYNDRFVQPVCP
jgi:hypothetical protein